MHYDDSWRALLKPGNGNEFFAMNPLPVFDTRATAFNAVNAWWLAEMSRLIYRGEPGPGLPGFPSRAAILAKLGIREAVFASSKDAQWALNRVAGPRPFAVLVFRGTSGFENWLANLMVYQSDWANGGHVHSGFKAIFMEIRVAIEMALRSVREPLIFTGHSLGGALAVLAASVWPPQATYTFGAPRVGDIPFRESLAGQAIFRVASERDIVTSVPPSRIPFEFCHIGKTFRFQLPGRRAPSSAAAARTDNRQAGARSAKTANSSLFSNPPRFLSEHAPINYSAGLARYLIQNPAVRCH